MAFNGLRAAHIPNDFGFGPCKNRNLDSNKPQIKRAPAILLYDCEGETTCVGSLNPDPTGRLAYINIDIVNEASYCGFRLTMTCHQLASERPVPFKSSCHDVLFRLRWVCRDTAHHQVLHFEKEDILSHASSKSLARDFIHQPLYYLQFLHTDDEYPFVIKDLGSGCRDRERCPAQHIITSLARGNDFGLYAHEERLIAGFHTWAANSYLARWSDRPYEDHDSVPETILRQWRGNLQNCIVAGLADLASEAFFNGSLIDGPNTKLDFLPLAQSVRHFLNMRFADIKAEPPGKAYPVFLDVPDSKFNQQTFTNEGNISVGLDLIADMMRSIPTLTPERIGVLAIYGAQAKAYSVALQRLHILHPNRGYADIRVGNVEWWFTRRAEVVILDMVRTKSGTIHDLNNGFLAQTVRLQVALTTHCHGLVIIADRSYLNDVATRTNFPKTLERVLQWLSSNGRIATFQSLPIPHTAIAAQPLGLSSALIQGSTLQPNRSANPSKKICDNFESDRYVFLESYFSLKHFPLSFETCCRSNLLENQVLYFKKPVKHDWGC